MDPLLLAVIFLGIAVKAARVAVDYLALRHAQAKAEREEREKDDEELGIALGLLTVAVLKGRDARRQRRLDSN